MITPSDFETELMPYVEVRFSAFVAKKSMIFSSILTTGHTNYLFEFWFIRNFLFRTSLLYKLSRISLAGSWSAFRVAKIRKISSHFRRPPNASGYLHRKIFSVNFSLIFSDSRHRREFLGAEIRTQRQNRHHYEGDCKKKYYFETLVVFQVESPDGEIFFEGMELKTGKVATSIEHNAQVGRRLKRSFFKLVYANFSQILTE